MTDPQYDDTKNLLLSLPIPLLSLILNSCPLSIETLVVYAINFYCTLKKIILVFFNHVITV